MLTIHQLEFRYGSRIIYQNASLQIKPRERIGLVGANGTGKSTLLKLIVGDYTPDSGQISRSNDCTMGYLNQDLLSFQSGDSILNIAMQAFERENRIEENINKLLLELEYNTSDEIINKLADLQSEFEGLGGYGIKSQAEEILEGLGFNTSDLQRPLREFSGGWRMRVMLAKLLLQKPALLLLDEPTNHLDLPSIEWLETYLRAYEGAVVIVSHDRYLLSSLANVIVDVQGGELHRYSGNYDFFIEERALRQTIQKQAFENQQQKIKDTERFIERFKAKASKAIQVQSRMKALERLEIIEDVDSPTAAMNIRFALGQPSGRIVAELKDVSKKFGNLQILKDSELTIERGDKIALIGANGKGKSTLLRIIAGTEGIEGQRTPGHNVIATFFAQHQLEALHLENTLVEELASSSPNRTENELRTILGCFLFSGEDALKRVRVLSGGEKSRVALAKTLLSQANFLLLDEPTNHLDITSVNILIEALKKYEGSFVVVSHDRHFVSQVANRIAYIEDHKICTYPGTFAEYQEWQSRQTLNNKQNAALPKTENKQKTAPPSPAQNAKSQMPNIKKLQNDLSLAEKKVIETEEKIKKIEQDMSLPQNLNNTQKSQELVTDYNALKAQLQKATEEWERILEQIG
ncbi:MAG: ABC transporter ATP-binding protein [Cytophagales bacterium]|nr:MAG: ABC transporter ATP-binding protein [Cytophagales bacterium]TAF61648.1 MAG: ABC transporter ATP-binding protein [Cytophagales bacterium]